MDNLHILKVEYLWNRKRYLKIVKSIFLLMQATCLWFKTALMKKKCNFRHSGTLSVMLFVRSYRIKSFEDL